MGYKILSQGVLDGACFMYSIMNAYKTLTYPEMDVMDFIYTKPYENFGKKKWEYLIHISPQTTDMLAGEGFKYLSQIKTLDLLNVAMIHYYKLIQECFEILSDKNHRFSVKHIGLEAIKDFDFTHSVMVLPVAKEIPFLAGNTVGNHAICVNGRTGDNLHVACSYSIYDIPRENYREMPDSNSGRYYNNMVKVKQLNEDAMEQYVNMIYQVTRIK